MDILGHQIEHQAHPIVTQEGENIFKDPFP